MVVATVESVNDTAIGSLYDSLFDNRAALVSFFKEKGNNTTTNRNLILKTPYLKCIYCRNICTRVPHEQCILDGKATCKYGWPWYKEGYRFLW